jgi:acyl dehydratase
VPVPDEVMAAARAAIGVRGPAVSHRIELGAIRRFVEAIGDRNPLYTDAEYARTTRFGGIIAPPTFLCTLRAGGVMPQLNFGRVTLNGGNEYEWYRPVRPGDVITAQATLADVRAVDGRSGAMLILTSEIRYTNQDDELVAIGRSTGIRRE